MISASKVHRFERTEISANLGEVSQNEYMVGVETAKEWSPL